MGLITVWGGYGGGFSVLGVCVCAQYLLLSISALLSALLALLIRGVCALLAECIVALGALLAGMTVDDE